MALRHWLNLSILLAAVASTGASCPYLVQPYALPLGTPQITGAPSADEIVAAVNANSALVQSFQASDALIHSPGLPTLRASVAVEQPLRFRLLARARFIGSGPEVDLGSNEQLFWLWLARSDPRATYFCTHDRFDHSAARRILPVEPSWLIDALGLTWLDPSSQHSQPAPHGEGRVALETRLSTEAGELRRVTVVSVPQAWVLEQYVYDSQGQMLAAAVAEGHERDALTGAVLPRKITIEWPPAELKMTVELRELAINRPVGDPQQLWSLPSYPDYPPVDLGDPRTVIPPTASSGPPKMR